VKISPDERDVLVAEARALAGELPPGEARDTFAEIAATAGAGTGEIPDELDGRVGQMLELSLGSGRARAEHGPEGVRAMTAIWRRTPSGASADRDARDLNTALSVLSGRPVEFVRVTPTGPGTSTVVISAGRQTVRLAADAAGIRLRSIDVGATDGGGE